MNLTIDQIKAVLDAAANIARDDNAGHPITIRLLDSAHEQAVSPRNLERIQHELTMVHGTTAIVKNPSVWQWLRITFFGV
jgi:hypothetical protein